MKVLSDSDIDKRDSYEERAAIYEFEAGMRRGAAEAKAWAEVYGVER